MLPVRSRIFVALFALCALLAACDEDTTTGPLQGKSGSMARFALAKDHLYVANETTIKVFQVGANGALTPSGTVEAGFGIETIFAKDDNLFLGADNGMYVYSITNPAVPKFVSFYNHIMACDPVVVQGQYAYVTLRVSNCRTTGFDALEVIDIRNLSNPVRVSSYATETPYGLGVDNNLLFVCHGDGGFKVFDVADPANVRQVKHYTSLHAYDVIPNQGVLLLTGNTGIYQYDYSDVLNIRQLSHIPVAP